MMLYRKKPYGNSGRQRVKLQSKGYGVRAIRFINTIRFMPLFIYIADTLYLAFANDTFNCDFDRLDKKI